MEPLVDIILEDPRWKAVGLSVLAEKAARATFAGLGLPAQGLTLCVMGCDDRRITELNTAFRAKGQPTNVLSFPSEHRAPAAPGLAPALPPVGDAQDPEALGDIAMSYDTCLREAAEQGKAVPDHVTHLLVHGILHLLGYDHIEDVDAALMEGREAAILASLGVDDPYLEPSRLR
jgi:probable rRNA maturation factor